MPPACLPARSSPSPLQRTYRFFLNSALSSPSPPLQRNYRFFLFFVYSTVALCCWVFALSVANLVIAARDAGWSFGTAAGDHPAAIVCAVYTFLVSGQVPRVPRQWCCLGQLWVRGGAESRGLLKLRQAPRAGAAAAGHVLPAVLGRARPDLPRSVCVQGFWFVGGLSALHTYLVCTNQTTYEHFRHRYSGERHACSRICGGRLRIGLRGRPGSSCRQPQAAR